VRPGRNEHAASTAAHVRAVHVCLRLCIFLARSLARPLAAHSISIAPWAWGVIDCASNAGVVSARSHGWSRVAYDEFCAVVVKI
jgi:hypothetical protein